MAREILNVKGMSCDHCKNSVESALAKLNGVHAAEADVEKGKVRVDFNDELVTMTQVKDAIEDQGYDVL